MMHIRREANHADKDEWRHNITQPETDILLHDTLSARQREMIDQIRSAAVRRNDLTDHSERLLAMLDTWLLDDEQKAVLAGDASQVTCLYASAYLMHAQGIEETGRSSGIPELWLAQAVSKVVRRCNRPVGEWRHAHWPEVDPSASTVPLDLLAGALALAERLDLNHPATLERIRRHIGASAEPPGEDWSRWFRIESCGPHPHQTGSVRVRIHCRNAELHRGLKHYETDVERHLDCLNKIVRPCFWFSKVRFEVRADGYEPLDFKFSVDSSAALQLFMGNTLYGDKRVFLRELVQNAVDACHLRSLSASDYTPAIAVRLNASEDMITVRDNGIGMDRRWLEKYFLNVGISFYRSGDFGDLSAGAGLQMTFISNFGIGFLSTFLAARRIRVRTRKSGSEGLCIAITDIGDYFDVRRADDHLPVGTEVRLELKPSPAGHWRNMEFLGYLKTAARYVSIPIRFTDAAGNTTVIGCEPMNSFGSNGAGQNFSAALSIAPSEGHVLIRTRGGNDRIFGLDSASGGISVFQNGIFITQTDDLLPAGARGHVVGRLNLKGHHRCELSMDRNRIFWPQQQLRFFRRAILRGIAGALGQLFTAADRQNVAPESRRKIEQTATGFFEPTTVDDDLFGSLHPGLQKLLRQQFRSFLRTSISKTDMPGSELSALAAAQGFQYRWQKAIIAAMAQ